MTKKANKTLIGLVVSLPAVLLLWATTFVSAQETKKVTPQQAEFFEKRVRPVLFNSCFSCHGEKLQQGGVRLDSLAHMLKGKSGVPFLIPGEPERSPLIEVIRYTGKVKMPPQGKLKPEEIEALETWVKMGAPWPGAKVSEEAKRAALSGEYVISDQQRKFWSFQPVKRPVLPKVQNQAWVRSPMDAFILARLEKRKIEPSPRADRRALIRRAYIDLTGLPPTMEEVQAFYADRSPDAFAKVVDRLLASPRFGERWARYWLDVARYSDTKGYVFTEDPNFHHAYTYRDWVIRAFNEDLPYNQFILQQLAADQLNLGEDRRPLAAMGFLTLGRRFLNNIHDIIDDRIDVVTRGMQGLTVNCARCHDHKYDPISAKDYYALHGIFNSSLEPNPLPTISPKEISEPFEAHNKKIRETNGQYEGLIKQQIQQLRQRVQSEPDSLPKPVKDTLQSIREGALPDERQLRTLEPQFKEEARQTLAQLRDSLSKLRQSVPPAPEFAMALFDKPKAENSRVFLRGNPGNLGAEAPRAYLPIVMGAKYRPFTQGSGRLELAQAIASPDNPLTARVMVNRIWLNLFGKGLVRTPSDFGMRGEPPTHPELLDYLAWKFMNDGWSVKRLIRFIMLSNTYQQASVNRPEVYNADPENRLVWRMNPRRLDLEAMRDSLLFVADRLDLTMGGRSVEITTAPYSTRRSVYGYIDRQNLQGLFRTFDFANPDTSSPQRYQTTTPQQALYMMNSPFVIEQAQHLARRQEMKDLPDDTARVRFVYRKVLGRTPAPEEIALSLRFLQSASQIKQASAAPQVPPASEKAWVQFIQTLMMSNEFIFLD
jgi:mono/diheme cytochrome c family protein